MFVFKLWEVCYKGLLFEGLETLSRHRSAFFPIEVIEKVLVSKLRENYDQGISKFQ